MHERVRRRAYTYAEQGGANSFTLVRSWRRPCGIIHRHRLRGLCWQALLCHRHQCSLFGVPMLACLRGSRLEPSTGLNVNLNLLCGSLTLHGALRPYFRTVQWKVQGGSPEGTLAWVR